MNKSFVKYFASLLIFGTNGVVASHIALSSHETVFWRSLFGSICLIAIFLLSGSKFTFMKHKKDFFFLALSGFGMGISWVALYEGYARIGVGVTTLLYYAGPVFVMVLAPFIFKEKLSLRKVMCFTVVIAGILLVNGSGEANDIIGIICGILAAVGYTIMVTTGKLSGGIKGLESPALQVVFAFLFCAVYHVAKADSPSRFSPPTFPRLLSSACSIPVLRATATSLLSVSSAYRQSRYAATLNPSQPCSFP